MPDASPVRGAVWVEPAGKIAYTANLTTVGVHALSEVSK